MRVEQPVTRSGQVVALFNGVRQRHLHYGARPAQDWSDYRISCDTDLDLDILAEHVSLEKYSATLGHKGRGREGNQS